MSLSRLLGKSPQELKQMSDTDIKTEFESKLESRNKNLVQPQSFKLRNPISIGITIGSALYLVQYFFKGDSK